MAVDITQLFQSMIRNGISDIHFKAGHPPMVRICGNLVSSGYTKMTSQHIDDLAQTLMSEDQRRLFQKEGELDMSYEVPKLSRFRINIYRQRGTMALSMRVVPLTIKTFENLMLPTETLQKLCSQSRGLILVAGVTGAGKTTTLNSMVNYINENFAYNIITVEDPIEYYHQDIKSFIAQREVGNDTESFAKAMKYVLRQDPDVVVLGEMRDDTSMQAGIMAAETGHLVLATIHTMDAAQTMDRLVESYDSGEVAGARARIANVLKGILCQRLVRSVDGNYLIPATEILQVTSLIRRLMTEGKTAEIHKALDQGNYYGMHTFDQDLIRLYKEKKISKEEAMDAASTPEDFTLKMSNQSSRAAGAS
jgi:twitching motility protein PilT